MLAPGATIGILGGGQLGRMTAQAAARLGFTTHIFSSEPECPGAQVTPLVTVAALDDVDALARFAQSVDVATYETENVPVSALEAILPHTPVRPGVEVLRVAQDRLREKDYLRSIDVATAQYREVTGPDALGRAIRDLGHRAVLKTVRMGYDGKGQVMITPDVNPAQAWAAIAGAADSAGIAILESFVDYRCEISVVVVRGTNGTIVNYPAVENQHANHMLDTTIVPARIAPELAMRAEAIARHIAEKLDVVGVLAVEMFVTHDDEILVNELAPRPHNSGHWTMDACYTSQFEQLVRAITGLPLGSTERHSDAVMKNLIGNDIDRWREIVAEPMSKLHLYGKVHARPGRKMGHVTRLLPRHE
ncbi:N5-carboxyaminoimidazole ribonucleotide synthase [Aliidongia dinghuensis]|uniref:N5-carboxyaminoimidazole ribonucleotide synthase n=1 Tax=Aliidongia dinghuensis TaxID=1867774 RepID=A0A8J3E656_9PROT|nr:5-(carboxyamino)imidazole ribonucleotide synthase [Aliidongia dinghuensis]GGF38295.1 N5-carboxyaminoimidazole ribonucleotide synthase [Aliidongia dinghuensis]